MIEDDCRMHRFKGVTSREMGFLELSSIISVGERNRECDSNGQLLWISFEVTKDLMSVEE